MNVSKKTIIVFVILVLIILGLFYVSRLNTNKSNVFVGSVKKVNDSLVLVTGVFENEAKIAKPLYDYTIKVNDKTKITKTSFVKPTDGQMFEVAKLPKEVKTADYLTLKKDSENVVLGVEIVLERNFINMVTNTAKEIKYIGPKY